MNTLARFKVALQFALAVGIYFWLFEVTEGSEEPFPDWLWILIFYGSPFLYGLLIGKLRFVLLAPLGAFTGFLIWQFGTADYALFDDQGWIEFVLDAIRFWFAPMAGSALVGVLANRMLNFTMRILTPVIRPAGG